MTAQELIFFSDNGNVFLFEDLTDGTSDILHAHSSIGATLNIGEVLDGVTVNRACIGLELDTCESVDIYRDGTVVLPLSAGLDHIDEIPLLPEPFTFRSGDVCKVKNLEGGA